MNDDVNLDFKVKTSLGKHFPADPSAFPKQSWLEKGHHNTDQYSLLT